MISPKAFVRRLGSCLSLAAGLAAGLMAGLGIAPGWADGESSFGRALELPAHRALIAGRAGVTADPFETDGCSGGLSDVWRLVADQFPGFAKTYDSTPPWESCCVTHDVAYHNGVNAPDAGASFSARLVADQTLEACVVDMGHTRRKELAVVYGITPGQVETAYATIGGAMFWAVRFGGGPCTGLPWRWGFGYPDCSILGRGAD